MQVEFFQENKIAIKQGQTILDAALNAGIPHFHACGGKGKCSTCRVLVMDGEQNLSAPNRKESRLKSVLKLPPTVRLACQTKVLGEYVKLERMIKAESEISGFLNPDEHLAGKFKLKPLGEEKNLVLFFLDIRDFTPFVETYLPFDVIYLVRKLFDIFYTVLTKHNGQIIETAGDGLYAIFGYDTSLKEAADSALEAGFEIFAELERLNRTYSKLFQKEFDVGIGVHSGKVIVGEVNYGTISKRSAMGLAVNIASRIENSTKMLNNSFIVSEAVIRQSSFNDPADATELKLDGIKVPIKVYLIGKAYNG